jgi:hypothetical protein
MLFVAVARIQHGGNAALRPVAGAVLQGTLGNDRDSTRFRQMQATDRPANPLPTIATSNFMIPLEYSKDP